MSNECFIPAAETWSGTPQRAHRTPHCSIGLDAPEMRRLVAAQ
jgi:hypothetical protein